MTQCTAVRSISDYMAVHVCGLLLMLCAPFGATIPLSSFYSYGSAVDDFLLPMSDDGSSSAIPLPAPFFFFGSSYTTIFVNNNGDMTFNALFSNYTPEPFPIHGNPMIAPFFADVDTRGTGKVWYRTTTNSTLLAKAVNDIPSIIAGPNFTPLWLFIATWELVGYYNNHTDKTNTFQCILATDNVQSFAIFQYADGLMQWTTGDASGGFGGLGGTPAQVGFNAGDSKNYANVQDSRSTAIINITSTSNVMVPGQWIFQVQNAIITSTGPSSPLNFTLSPVPHSPYQLSAMWSAPSVKYGNITKYTVYCNISANQVYPEQVIGPNVPTIRSVVNGTTFSTILTGLLPSTQYQCYVTAANSYGEGGGSLIAIGTTDESAPFQPGSISLNAIPGSPNQLTATWTPPIPKNGIITAYTVYCNTSATQPTIRSVVNGTTLTTILTGLIPYTQYECYVTANTSVGEGAPSQVVNSTTSETVPTAPRNVSLAVVPGLPNQLTATWTPPIPTNSIITAYTVYCNTSVNQVYPEQVIGPNVPKVRSVVSGMTQEITFSRGLSPYTQYECYVTANSSVGEGTPSQIVMIKTSESVPSPPQSVALGSIFGSPNQLFIVWTPPIPKNGIITAYTVYCNTSANQVYPEQVIGPNIPTIRSVVDGTTLATIVNTTYSLILTQYGCYVTANTSVGEGSPSPTVRSTTCETAAPALADTSKVTTNAVSATLTVIIVLILILMVIAIVVTALIARRHRRDVYVVAQSVTKENKYATVETTLNVSPSVPLLVRQKTV